MEIDKEKILELLKTILVPEKCEISIADKNNPKYKLYYAAFQLSDEELEILKPGAALIKEVLNKMAIEIDLVDYYNNKKTIRFKAGKTFIGYSPITQRGRLLLYHDTSNATMLKAASIKFGQNH